MKRTPFVIALAAIAATSIFTADADAQSRRPRRDSKGDAPAPASAPRNASAPAETDEEIGMPISLVFAGGNIQDPIRIRSVTFSVANGDDNGQSATRRRSAPRLSGIELGFESGSHSPLLWEAALNGRAMPTAVIRYRSRFSDDGRGNTTYMTFELKNVLVTSFNHKHNDEGEAPSETITLNFEEIKTTYTEFSNDGRSRGNTEADWNVFEAR